MHDEPCAEPAPSLMCGLCLTQGCSENEIKFSPQLSTPTRLTFPAPGTEGQLKATSCTQATETINARH
jgi:hypothetical protein